MAIMVSRLTQTPDDWFLMIFSTAIQLSASKQNLRLVNLIRYLAVLGQLSAVLYTHFNLGKLNAFYPIVISIGCLLSIALYTSLRLRKGAAITQAEFFTQLVLDISCFTSVLYFSGGSTNPFVSYYLVPLTITAATLPGIFTWVMASLTLGAYSLLMFFYIPLSEPHHHQDTSFSLHIFGMWMNFLISTLLITFFVVRMAQALRRQEAQIAEKREEDLRDQQLVAIATVAAGAAHELGTPLSTMAILLEELEQHPLQDETKEDFELLKQQLAQCKRILQTLSNDTDLERLHQRRQTGPAQYLNSVIDRWQLLHPEAKYQTHFESLHKKLRIEVDTALDQAIISLLNNAVDASPDYVELTATVDAQQLNLFIRDKGEGVPISVIEKLGSPFLSTKDEGMGLGLYLSSTSINKLGGTLKMYNHEEKGTVVELGLPLL